MCNGMCNVQMCNGWMCSGTMCNGRMCNVQMCNGRMCNVQMCNGRICKTIEVCNVSNVICVPYNSLVNLVAKKTTSRTH